LGFLKEVCREVSIPVYGIGGIKFDEEQWNDMKKCGAVGGCVMSGMMEI
jgi:thiamine-phosphate pyrophosphorylase